MKGYLYKFQYTGPHCIEIPPLRSTLSLLADPICDAQVKIDKALGEAFEKMCPRFYLATTNARGACMHDVILRERWAWEVAYNTFLSSKFTEEDREYVLAAVNRPARSHPYWRECLPMEEGRHGRDILAAGFFAVYAHDYFSCMVSRIDPDNGKYTRFHYASVEPYMEEIGRYVRALVKRMYDAEPQAKMANNPYECSTLYDRIHQCRDHTPAQQAHYCVYMPITEDSRSLYDVLSGVFTRSRFLEEALDVAVEEMKEVISRHWEARRS